MGPVHVLGTVRGVGEGLATPLKLADVWPLARVGAEMGLEVLQSGVRLETTLILKGNRKSIMNAKPLKISTNTLCISFSTDFEEI